MKKITFVMIGIFTFQSNFAQVSMDKKGKLYKDGQEYRLKDYQQVFENPKAEALFKKARNNSTAANVLGFAGGGFIGYGLARVLSGKNNKSVQTNSGVTYQKETKGWGAVGVGVGLVVIAIPFISTANKKAKEAITIENGESVGFKPHFKLQSAGTGLALVYNF